MKGRSWVCLVVLGLCVVPPRNVAAQTLWRPEALVARDEAPKATVRRELVRVLSVAGRRIVLEETELSEVARHFGVGADASGDASEFLQWVCLAGTAPEGAWILWLTSGEIDGGRVGGFQLRRLLSGEKPDGRCGGVRTKDAPVTTPRALVLGMSRRDLSRALGRPTIMSGDLAEYWHEHQVRLPSQGGRLEPFTSSNSVTVLFRRDVVSAIQVWRTTTN